MITEFVTPLQLVTRYTAENISQRASHGIVQPQIADTALVAYLTDETLPGDATDAAVAAVGARVKSAVDGANGIVQPYAMRARAVTDVQPFSAGFQDAAAKIAIFNLSNKGKSADATDKVTLDYEAAIDWLRMVAEHGSDAIGGSNSDPGWRNVSVRRA